MKSKWSNKLSRILAALFLAVISPIAKADTLILNNGKVMQGTVENDSNETVVFLDANVGRVQLSKAQIKEIQKTSTPPANGGVSNPLEFAQAERKRGRSTEALKYYLQAAEADATGAASREMVAYFQELANQAHGKISTLPDQARVTLRGMYDLLAQPNAEKHFNYPQSAFNFQQAASIVSADLAEANFQLAQRMRNNTSMKAQVQELLNESVSLTQKRNPTYLLAHGDAARNNNDLESGFNSLKALVESGLGSPEQKNEAYDLLNRISVASNGRYKMTYATAAGTPVPPVIIAHATPTPTLQDTVTTTVAAAPPASNLPWWKRLIESVKNGTILDELSSLTGGLITTELLTIIGIGIGVILLLWWLPYMLLKFMAKRGDSLAGEKLFNAKKLGPIAFVGYLWKKFSEKSMAKHRCPFCNRGIDNMEDYKDLNFVVCPHCREPITPIYEMSDYVEHLIGQLKISQKASSKGLKGDALIEKDAMLKLVRGVLALAIRRRASDFHLETLNEGGKVRARIDGIMYDLITLPREIAPAFISAIKVMAQLDITERRVPQDGKISLWLDQKDFDLRVNTSPASLGEKVVIRILRQDSINISPDRLGLDGDNLIVFERNINKPHGVIIVTGPSGSGKSTSLYVALNQLNVGDKNIVTIEDPIEYHLQGLSQMQVNPGANFTFATGLRSILRQDPDVIMVGEIRDKETAEAALDAAMTGHLVLTTLHTIDAPSAFSRMHDLGIEQMRVANAVNLVIAQRLIRTVCPDCRKTYKPKSADLEKLGIKVDDEITFVHGTGCETCMNTGYHGRLAIFEMLELNDALRGLLETNVPTTALREAAKKHGLRTLREEGLRKIHEGVTTVEEVIRVTT